MKFIYCILIIALISEVMCPVAYSSEDTCGSFELAKKDQEDIFLTFEGAVFRLEIVHGNTRIPAGTGILVDTRGYTIALLHLVKQAFTGQEFHVVAHSSEMPARDLLLKPFSALEAKHLALLRLEPAELLTDLIPLDISFEVPDMGAEVYVMGYRPNKMGLSKEVARFVDSTKEGLMQVRGGGSPGEGGSPLIDETGKAIGIWVSERKETDTSALYIPMVDSIDLLKKIPETPRVRTWDLRIRSAASLADLCEELKPKPTHISNLELFGWAAHISQVPMLYRKHADYVVYPIISALLDRNVDDAVVPLLPLAGAGTIGKALSNVASRDSMLRRTDSATLAAEKAIQLLRKGIREYVEKEPLNFQFGLCRATGVKSEQGQLQLGNPAWLTFEAKTSAKGPSGCSVGHSDDNLSSLFGYSAAAAITLAGLKTGLEELSLYEEAASNAALAVATGEDEPADAYFDLGLALYGTGDYKDAAAAFASAYNSGEKTKVVEENWQRADKADKKERGEEHINSTIKTAPKLVGRSLSKHIIYSFKAR